MVDARFCLPSGRKEHICTHKVGIDVAYSVDALMLVPIGLVREGSFAANELALVWLEIT